jgi:hypothetical protein
MEHSAWSPVANFNSERRILHRHLKLRVLLLIASCLFALSATSAFAQVRLASRFGEANIGGQRVLLHVTVAVPPGANEEAVANDALRGQGARPFQPEEFTTIGLVWDDFFDPAISQPEVVLHYNAAGAPVDAHSALQGAQDMWNDVGTSRFWFTSGDPTNRCPSLVRECPGEQIFDGFNDVGWVNIGGCCTLAVTWYSTSIDEIDQALNTRFPWTTNGGTGYDVETVMGHENGHALGLGHTSANDSIMQAVYAGVHPYLGLDDVRGVTYLYPEPGVAGTISGTVSSGGVPVAGARVKIANVPASTTTDASGAFMLEGIPDLDVYSVTASASGYKTKTVEPVEVGGPPLVIELERRGK